MQKLLLLLFLTTSYLFASIGSLSLVEGKVFIDRDNSTFEAKLGDGVEKNDLIKTGVNSKARVTFSDDTIVTIGKDSTLDITKYSFDSSSQEVDLSITKGAFHTITGQIGKINPSKFKLKTKTASIGIRGTEIYGDQTRVACTQGAIFVESFGEVREMGAGSFVDTFGDRAPSSPQPLSNEVLNEIGQGLNTASTMPSGGLDPYEDDSGLMEPETGTQPGPEAQGLDTQESWGYWASSASEERDDLLAADGVDNILFADLGEVTDPSYVQSLIEGTEEHQLDFTGIIVPLDGELLSGETIEKSNINISFLFGANNPMFDFNYDFKTSYRTFGGEAYPDTQSVTSSGFSGTAQSGESISGKFYGPEINAVAGDISMVRSTGPGMEILDGTFKATR
ncbi:MAG: FecR family protein [Campylobacterales bacterium]|nr:FecR family protein [Campylobacterales bacterium]